MQLQFIDDRNRSLWESSNQQLPIIIETHSNDHFYHYFKEDTIILFVPAENGTIELFTHQLLHLHLTLSGINITTWLKDRLRNEPLLHWTFNENLFEQIGACLEHWKMLPAYLSMGFERDLFCETYYMSCCNEMSMLIIKSGMNKEVPAKASVDLFIHKFFAMKTCLNPGFNYCSHLNELKLINAELCSILENFWTQWNDFDIQANTRLLKSSTYDFMHELGTWNILNIYAKEKMRA
jgi:hypothetical protein